MMFVAELLDMDVIVECKAFAGRNAATIFSRKRLFDADITIAKIFDVFDESNPACAVAAVKAGKASLVEIIAPSLSDKEKQHIKNQEATRFLNDLGLL